jgi:hypothetical protein
MVFSLVRDRTLEGLIQKLTEITQANNNAEATSIFTPAESGGLEWTCVVQTYQPLVHRDRGVIDDGPPEDAFEVGE